MLGVEEEPARIAHMALNLNTAHLKLTNQRALEVNRNVNIRSSIYETFHISLHNVNIVNVFCGG